MPDRSTERPSQLKSPSGDRTLMSRSEPDVRASSIQIPVPSMGVNRQESQLLSEPLSRRLHFLCIQQTRLAAPLGLWNVVIPTCSGIVLRRGLSGLQSTASSTIRRFSSSVRINPPDGICAIGAGLPPAQLDRHRRGEIAGRSCLRGRFLHRTERDPLLREVNLTLLTTFDEGEEVGACAKWDRGESRWVGALWWQLMCSFLFSRGIHPCMFKTPAVNVYSHA